MKRVMLQTLGALVFLASFAYADVKTDYDHSVMFGQYRTFTWKMPTPQTPNGIVNNSLVANRIEQAVDRQLRSKGLQQATGNPDLYVVYHIGAKREKDLEYFPSLGWGWRYRRGWWGSDAYINRYIKGSVVIDLVDVHTNQLVWRAFLTDTGSHLSDVQSNKTITKLVDRAFKQFPPKQA